MRVSNFLPLVVCLALAGCAAEVVDVPDESQEPRADVPAPDSPPMPTEPVPEEAVPEEAVEQVEAEVGVGQKGRSLETEEAFQPLARPAVSYFRTKEKLTFEVQIPKALELYKNLHGRMPQSHDEFMKEIIRANNIRLPDLPPGERYSWDTEQEKLMVVRPAR